MRNLARRFVPLPLILAAVVAAAFVCLAGDGSDGTEGEIQQQPLVPLPQTVPAPKDNPTTSEKVALGKQLFFDLRLFGDNTMRCATCYLPEKAFGDGLPRAKGRDGKILARNTPSLLNVGFYSTFFWDGRAKSLEEQALMPIQAPDEMNQDLDALEEELNAVPGYVEQFRKVFGTGVTRDGVAWALAAFERTLVTKSSPYDRYLAGDQDALSVEAKRGLALFAGDADCIRCHRGSLLSDGKFYRLGLASRDEGRMVVSGKKEDKGRFRTPSLRNISRTGPYMHNGSRKSLAEVVEFYFRGVPPEAADGQPLDVQSLLSLTFTEIPAVVAFLESLIGEAPEVSPPELP